MIPHDAYGEFLKPRLAELLRASGLDVSYERAAGDSMFYRDRTGRVRQGELDRWRPRYGLRATARTVARRGYSQTISLSANPKAAASSPPGRRLSKVG